MAARRQRLRTGWASILLAAAVGLFALGGSGCAKGRDILEDQLVYLDPRRPTPMDASAEAGAEPPEEVPIDPALDAAAPPTGEQPSEPDASVPLSPDDAGSDAAAAADGG